MAVTTTPPPTTTTAAPTTTTPEPTTTTEVYWTTAFSFPTIPPPTINPDLYFKQHKPKMTVVKKSPRAPSHVALLGNPKIALMSSQCGCAAGCVAVPTSQGPKGWTGSETDQRMAAGVYWNAAAEQAVQDSQKDSFLGWLR